MGEGGRESVCVCFVSYPPITLNVTHFLFPLFLSLLFPILLLALHLLPLSRHLLSTGDEDARVYKITSVLSS